MRIINSDKTYSPKEAYRFTLDPAIRSLKDMKGQGPLKVEGWMQYEDTDRTTGEVKTILAISTDKGVFGTNSPTAREDFESICSLYGEGELPEPIEVLSGTSKSGREFVKVRLAD